MTNREVLVLYYENLCKNLNGNGFYQVFNSQGEIKKYEYAPDYDSLGLTMIGITENLEGYNFLLRKGLIRKDICHECGEILSGKTYLFTEPFNKITYSICKSCFNRGRRTQQSFGISQPQSGCLVTVLIFIIVTLIIAWV